MPSVSKMAITRDMILICLGVEQVEHAIVVMKNFYSRFNNNSGFRYLKKESYRKFPTKRERSCNGVTQE